MIAKRGIVRTFQLNLLFRSLSVRENVRFAYHLHRKTGVVSALLHTPAVRREESGITRDAERILEEAGMGDRRDQMASDLSYGWQKTLTLAIGIAANPRLLLLDEPLTGISPTRIEAIASLIRRARDAGTTICVIEHNVNLLMDLCDRIVALNAGRKMADGEPQEVTRNQTVIESYLGALTMLSISDLSIHYGNFEAIRDLDLEVPERQTVSLLGANGSGKSTILKTISGIKRRTRGEIRFEGTRIDEEKPENIVKMGIASVMEGRRLFPYMTVLENLRMGAFSRSDAAGVRETIDEMFARFPVLEEKANERAGLLSGGQQEMVAVARGLMAKPKLLVMDEPCQGLSPIMVKEISSIIHDLKEEGMTILLVEHNVSVALGAADKVYILRNGQIRFEGKPDEFSQDEFVQKVYLAG